MPARTTARTAEFIPGASPPLVKTPIFFIFLSSRFLTIRADDEIKYGVASSAWRCGTSIVWEFVVDCAYEL
jgi:hypothetical protein